MVIFSKAYDLMRSIRFRLENMNSVFNVIRVRIILIHLMIL
jgi:hypothetical protein